MRDTITISLPPRLRTEVERKIEKAAYSSASEYLRDLIRKDLHAEAIEKVDALLLEGLHSGPGKPITKTFWRKLKAAATKPARRRA